VIENSGSDRNDSRQILSLNQICKRFGETVALSNISFDLQAGEVHCLVGENGAGKSTLIKILSGAYTPTSGSIQFDGAVFQRMTPALSRKQGIETIYQENIICPDVSVTENIYLGAEYRRGIFYDRKRMLADASKLICDMGVEIDPRAIMRDLSPGQQKIIQVLKAMVQAVRILILDEPTASFSTNEIEALLAIVLRIRNQGTGIIFISHHLEEVFRIADRITVLKDGEGVATHQRGACTSEQLICEMTGRDPSKFFKKQHHAVGGIVLEAEHYSRGRTVKDTSFRLHKGEILGFAGMVGSGRSELMRLIYGADRKKTGFLKIKGRKVHISSPRSAVRNGICLLPEDRKRDANIHGQSVMDNIMLSKINLSGRLFRSKREEKLSSQKYVDLLRIKTPGIRNSINNLSGGNQQKVVLARWLLVDSEIFIFDEPTRGIDVGAKEEIYRLMNDLAMQGKSIIMISSELPELIAMSDRALIMKNGAIVGELVGEEINEQRILEYSIGRVAK